MKVFVVFAAIVAAVKATAPVLLETGASAQFRSDDNYGNYNFGYNEDHTSGGTFRREAGDAHGNVAGSYGLRDADGRVRIVNYIANDDGFKAAIQTNEPGVVPEDPADATINKGVIATAAAVPVVAAAPAPIHLAAAPAPIHLAAAPAPIHLAAEPIVAVPQSAPVAVKSAYAFPAPVAAVKSSTFAIAEPAPVAVPAPAPVSYAFPAPAAVPVAKTHVAVAETAPVAYQFPAPAVVPVAKSSSVTVTEHAVQPAAYAFPAPAAVPVAKSSVAVVESAPTAYAFPPAPAVPFVKSSVAVAHPAPIPYAFPAPAAVPVAKSYAAPLAIAAPATTKVSYSTHVVNHAPAAYAVKSADIAYAAPAPVAVKSYAYNPYFYGVHSPVVTSFAGPVLPFNNIAYPGFPLIKK